MSKTPNSKTPQPNLPPAVPRISIPPIEFTAGGPNDEIKQANLEAVQPSPGFVSLAILAADSITKRADVVLLDYTQTGTSVRYKVDGVWHSMAAMDRQTGDYLAASLKRLSNLNHLERVQKQEGDFVAIYLKFKHKCKVVSQGVQTGERIAIYISRQKPPMDSLVQMGMREKQREKLASILNQDRGMVLASYLPDDLSDSFWTGLLTTGDRFMRDFFVMQEARAKNEEIINVSIVPYNGRSKTGLRDSVQGLLLREPNVVGFSEISDGDAVDLACELVIENELTTVMRIPSRDVFDAILRILVLQPDPAKFADALTCVVSQRTIRILCDHCRQPFTPNQQLITQLGLPVNRVTTMFTHFQPRPEEMVDQQGNPIEWEPCPKCGGPGYFERTGIFELLIINDALRKLIANQPTRQSLIDAAVDAGHVSIRDEGVLKVVKGVTSLEELRRVLKL